MKEPRDAKKYQLLLIIYKLVVLTSIENSLEYMHFVWLILTDLIVYWVSMIKLFLLIIYKEWGLHYRSTDIYFSQNIYLETCFYNILTTLNLKGHHNTNNKFRFKVCHHLRYMVWVSHLNTNYSMRFSYLTIWVWRHTAKVGKVAYVLCAKVSRINTTISIVKYNIFKKLFM